MGRPGCTPAGLPARGAAGADVGIVGHVHGLQEVAGQVVDARGKLAEVSRIRAAEDVVAGARGAKRWVGGEHDHLIDHEFLPSGAVRQADDSAEIPQPAGHLEQFASIDPPRRRRVNVRRVRTHHKNWLADATQPAREVAGQRCVGDDENAPVAAQRQVAGFRLRLRRPQRPAQQAIGLAVRLCGSACTAKQDALRSTTCVLGLGPMEGLMASSNRVGDSQQAIMACVQRSRLTRAAKSCKSLSGWVAN